MSLGQSRGASTVTDISGRLVFEVQGSACAGYSVSRRFVSHIASEQSVTTNDQRLTTFEEPDGSRYRFISRSYHGETLRESVNGLATRRDNAVHVDLSEPQDSELLLPSDVLFPFQHLKKLIAAAHNGETMVSANVFEGADAGQTVYEASAAIGLPGSGAVLPVIADIEPLSDLPRWHVDIAYFDHSEGLAELPEYEFSYTLLSNGVSTDVFLDYGDFTLRGELVSLELLDTPACE